MTLNGREGESGSELVFSHFTALAVSVNMEARRIQAFALALRPLILGARRLRVSFYGRSGQRQ